MPQEMPRASLAANGFRLMVLHHQLMKTISKTLSTGDLLEANTSQ